MFRKKNNCYKRSFELNYTVLTSKLVHHNIHLLKLDSSLIINDDLFVNAMSSKPSDIGSSITPVELEQMSHKEIMLVQWEEWALSIEEHYHTIDLFNRNPGGLPMGHR